MVTTVYEPSDGTGTFEGQPRWGSGSAATRRRCPTAWYAGFAHLDARTGHAADAGAVRPVPGYRHPRLHEDRLLTSSWNQVLHTDDPARADRAGSWGRLAQAGCGCSRLLSSLTTVRASRG